MLFEKAVSQVAAIDSRWMGIVTGESSSAVISDAGDSESDSSATLAPPHAASAIAVAIRMAVRRFTNRGTNMDRHPIPNCCQFVAEPTNSSVVEEQGLGRSADPRFFVP